MPTTFLSTHLVYPSLGPRRKQDRVGKASRKTEKRERRKCVKKITIIHKLVKNG